MQDESNDGVEDAVFHWFYDPDALNPTLYREDRNLDGEFEYVAVYRWDAFGNKVYQSLHDDAYGDLDRTSEWTFDSHSLLTRYAEDFDGDEDWGVTRTYAYDDLVLLALFDDMGDEHVVASPLAVVLPDADDLPFLEVALRARARALVTGNLRHYPQAAREGVRVCSPAELVAEWARGKQRNA